MTKDLEAYFDQNYHCIDYWPEISMSDRFSDLEDFVLNNYIEEFAEKMFRIVFKLMAYYDVRIFFEVSRLDPDDDCGEADSFSSYRNRDLSDQSLEKIRQLLRYVVCNEKWSELTIMLVQPDIMIDITNGINIGIYKNEIENLESFKLIKQIVESEGLFIRACLSN